MIVRHLHRTRTGGHEGLEGQLMGRGCYGKFTELMGLFLPLLLSSASFVRAFKRELNVVGNRERRHCFGCLWRYANCAFIYAQFTGIYVFVLAVSVYCWWWWCCWRGIATPVWRWCWRDLSCSCGCGRSVSFILLLGLCWSLKYRSYCFDYIGFLWMVPWL